MQMAEREEGGWPLGLHTLNGRVSSGLVLRSRNRENSGSASFSTLLTGSPTSSNSNLSSWDLDSESTGSFFGDRSITLGSLMGAASILEITRRSSRFRTSEVHSRGNMSHQTLRHSKPWLFSLCSRLCTDAVRIETAPSLGHFLEAERKKSNNNPPPLWDSNLTSTSSHNPQAAPPTGNVSLVAYAPRQQQVRQLIAQETGYGVPFLLSCLRGSIIG
ncbi:hypothetical protein SAY86_024811 [Trapa natans]|uniref:Uncharacterized protein n=1 Tax=Trapa natans TaxID=22666 RepID=A0AAN7MQS7_TRANT|nr:hypothetical protein SAY86_024811 [Trapa natans]